VYFTRGKNNYYFFETANIDAEIILVSEDDFGRLSA
jgi:hypothetical protein